MNACLVTDWNELSLVLMQVVSRKRTYKANSADLLHAYLLSSAAHMHYTADEPSTSSSHGSNNAHVPLGMCLLAAAAVAVAQQVE